MNNLAILFTNALKTVSHKTQTEETQREKLNSK